MAYIFQLFDTTTRTTKLISLAQQSQDLSGSVTGSQVNFVTTFEPILGTLNVYLDGLIVKTSNYSVNYATKTITFSTAPALGQEVYVTFIKI